MVKRPTLYWDADPSALYMLLIEDLDILEDIGDVQFKHWLVTNIPGNLCSYILAGWEILKSLD